MERKVWKIHRREHKRYNKVLEGLGEDGTKRKKDKGKRKKDRGKGQNERIHGRRLNVLPKIWRLCQEDGVTESERKFITILGLQTVLKSAKGSLGWGKMKFQHSQYYLTIRRPLLTFIKEVLVEGWG